MEKAADEVLAYFEKNGYSAFKVGGCVRDKLIGCAVEDIDIATSATPEQVMSLFPRVIPTGMKHGTVTVIWKDYSFECTTYRLETTYSNHRQPDRVEFVKDIIQDLKRRDFTINAMAMDRQGNLVDPFGGEQDLRRGLLRTVGDPYERLTEDALRILRGIRFTSRFSLCIESSTWTAMRSSGHLLNAISTERIRDELDKIMGGEQPERALSLLSTRDFLPFTDLRDLFSESRIQNLPQGLGKLPLISRWVGCVLHAGWKSEQFKSFLRRWRFSNRSIQTMLNLFKISVPSYHTEIQAKKYLLKYGLPMILQGVAITQWLTGTVEPPNMEQWKAWDEQLPIRQVRGLVINGQDLIQRMGRQPGPWVGEVLHTLFELVALHGVSNRKEILLAEARKVLNTSEGTDIKPI